MYKIGYVDENQDEVKKFERKLRGNFEIINYNIPKGLNKEDLLDQIYDSKVDLLMVDFLMKDKGFLNFNGDDIVRDYAKIMPNFPMIIFTNNPEDAFPDVDMPNIIYDKKDIDDSPKFIKILEKNIIYYQNYILERKKRIAVLIEKREKEGLNAKEKEDLFKNQLDLNNLDQRTQEVPGYLVNDLKLDELTATTKDAEEFLNLLKSKNAQNPDASI